MKQFASVEGSDQQTIKIITALNNSKAKDIYGIDSNFLKLHKEVLAPPLTHLVNSSLKNSIVPKAWKVAIIMPVFKAGDKSDLNNYRPISILPVTSKVIGKWVSTQIIEFLSSSQTPLHPMQFGFCPHHSTETALVMFMEKIKYHLVYLDLKRAFDTVSHQLLLSKLSHVNFSDQTTHWFQSYLSHREQCTVVDGARCALMDMVGVGPILFSLYFNDLPEHCLHVDVQLYVDRS